MITPDNVLIHELIGLEAEVVRCADRGMEGAKGKVVDETRNTLVMETGAKEKTVPKKPCLFRFTLPDGRKVEVEGKMIAFDPVERSKKLAQHCRVI
ncbi:MAG: ribonuclease P protein component 1 [Candidatus ainarchaeum sp.]|nr:ribonuclease P protein component 1 [Candidatus ainarchaeum sp.]